MAKKSSKEALEAQMMQQFHQVTVEEAVGCVTVEVIEPEDYDQEFAMEKKKPNKQIQILEQLEADKEELQRRVALLEQGYRIEHPEPKPGYTSPVAWIMLLLVIGLFYFIYVWVKSQGGLPSEFYRLLERIHP